jgi:hypothetical protein
LADVSCRPAMIRQNVGERGGDLPPGRRTPLLAHAAKAVISNWTGLR